MKKLLFTVLLFAIASIGFSQVSVSGQVEHATFSQGGEFHVTASGGSGYYLYGIASPLRQEQSPTGNFTNLPPNVYSWYVLEYVWNSQTASFDIVTHNYPEFTISYVSGAMKQKEVIKHTNPLGSFGFKPKRN